MPITDANPLSRGDGTGGDLISVTPNDSTDLATAGRAIRCRPDGTAGTLRFRNAAGTQRDTAIAVGELLLVGVSRIHATGTTATGLEILV